MRVWQENVNRVTAFYNSDYYEELKHTQPVYIRSVCNAIMEDPDCTDAELMTEKVCQLNNTNIIAKRNTALDGDTILTLDCVTGWKALFDLHNGERDWINDYAEIRQSLNAHLLWPRHGNNTINTVRYRVFKDRIDYTLYDIKRFYEDSEELRLQDAYNDDVTAMWLRKFETFENLVTKMHLGCFCTVDMEIIDLSVIDLSDGLKKITGYKDNCRTIDITYINNLKNVIA